MQGKNIGEQQRCPILLRNFIKKRCSYFVRCKGTKNLSTWTSGKMLLFEVAHLPNDRTHLLQKGNTDFLK